MNNFIYFQKTVFLAKILLHSHTNFRVSIVDNFCYISQFFRDYQICRKNKQSTNMFLFHTQKSKQYPTSASGNVLCLIEYDSKRGIHHTHKNVPVQENRIM